MWFSAVLAWHWPWGRVALSRLLLCCTLQKALCWIWTGGPWLQVWCLGCIFSSLCTILSFPGGASLTSPTWQCTQPGGAMAWPPSCCTTWSKPTWARTSPCMSPHPTQPYCSIKSLDSRWLQDSKWYTNIISKKKVEEFVSNFYTRYLPPDSQQSPHALFLRWRVAQNFHSYHCLFRLARWGFITSQETTVILKTFTIIKLTIVASKAFQQKTSLSELYKRTIMSSGFVTEAEVGPNNSNDLKASL